jgi:PAS domain S-box-containing protein
MESENNAALLAAIVDSSDDAIVSKTLDGVITSWNPAAEKMFGYTAAEAIGKHITLIIPQERLGEEAEILARIRRGERLRHFETIRQTKAGDRLDISLTVSPVRDAQGRVIGVSKMARDITLWKRSEREREVLLRRERAASQEAQEANRLLNEKCESLRIEIEAREKAQAELAEAVGARDQFIAVAAHELRNPLNVFHLTLQLLYRISSNPAGHPQMRGLIEKSRMQLARLTALVDRLLDVTRIRVGTFELYRETFDLSGLIREVANRFASEKSTSSVSLNLETTIEGDWDRIRIDQAFTNLISNAMKYGKDKPITVNAFVRDGCAVVEIQDQGIGISAADLTKAFDRFERLTSRASSDGLGLGLWITKQIVEAHRGTIIAESELSKGSVFTMTLPLHDQQENRKEAKI